MRDAGRAGDVIARIRALVEKATPRRDPVAVNDAILDVLGLLQAEVDAARHRAADGAGRAPAAGPQRQGAAAAGGAQPGGGTSGGLTVAVRDTGPGLGAGNPERLFEAFHSTKPEGLGMGLAICRSIVEAHGGRSMGRGERTARCRVSASLCRLPRERPAGRGRRK